MMSLPVWLPGTMFLLVGVSVPGHMFLLGGLCPGGLCPGKQICFRFHPTPLPKKTIYGLPEGSFTVRKNERENDSFLLIFVAAQCEHKTGFSVSQSGSDVTPPSPSPPKENTKRNV